MENSDFGNIKREQITAMTSVMGLYKALNRYMIERTSDGTAIVYRLTINGMLSYVVNFLCAACVICVAW